MLRPGIRGSNREAVRATRLRRVRAVGGRPALIVLFSIKSLELLSEIDSMSPPMLPSLKLSAIQGSKRRMTRE